MIRLVIVGYVTPGLNVLMRRHFGRRKKDRAEWAALILYAMRRQNLTLDECKAKGKRRLTIERFERGQGLDTDGLYGEAKDLSDEIARHGLVLDDTPKNCELIVKQWKPLSGAKKHTVITLEDVE